MRCLRFNRVGYFSAPESLSRPWIRPIIMRGELFYAAVEVTFTYQFPSISMLNRIGTLNATTTANAMNFITKICIDNFIGEPSFV